MTNVRLIDHEGVTIVNAVMNDPPDNPRHYIYMVSQPKLTCADSLDIYSTLDINNIEYKLERRDGGGTFIYRRVTPLWKENSG